MKLYSREDLKDSRIFFDKEPPRYMSTFIIMLLLIFVAAIILASFVKKTYVVKAQGVVAIEDTSYVASKASGVITSIYAKSGDYVKEGDILMVISSGSEGLQASIVQEQIDDLVDTLKIMQRYEQALINKKNTLSPTGKELDFYGKVNYYLDIIKLEKYEKSQVQSELDEKTSELEKSDKEFQKMKSKLDDLILQENKYSDEQKIKEEELNSKLIQKDTIIEEITLIENQISALPNTEENANEITALEKQLTEKANSLNKLNKEIKAIESTLNEIVSKVENVKSKKSEIEAELETISSKRESLIEETKHLKQQANTPFSQASQTFNQFMSELGQARSEIEYKITELRANLEATESHDAIHFITALKSGELHYTIPFAVGMSIQQNQILGEIGERNNDYYIEAFINAADRSKVKIGDSVKVSVIGINTYRFGTLSGKIDFIDPGTLETDSPNGKNLVYRSRIVLDENFLNSNSGEIVELIRSIPVEARIVYDEETILEWFLNLLNLEFS